MQIVFFTCTTCNSIYTEFTLHIHLNLSVFVKPTQKNALLVTEMDKSKQKTNNNAEESQLCSKMALIKPRYIATEWTGRIDQKREVKKEKKRLSFAYVSGLTINKSKLHSKSAINFIYVAYSMTLSAIHLSTAERQLRTKSIKGTVCFVLCVALTTIHFDKPLLPHHFQNCFGKRTSELILFSESQPCMIKTFSVSHAMYTSLHERWLSVTATNLKLKLCAKFFFVYLLIARSLCLSLRRCIIFSILYVK